MTAKILTSNWAYEKAGHVCLKVQSGKTPKDGFVEMSGIPFLKVYNIVGQSVSFDYRPQYISAAIQNGPLSISRTFPNDVLMNIVGPPLGKVAVVPSSAAEWNINQAIVLFRPSERITSKWIYYFLRSGQSIADIVNETRGSAGQVNISLSQCRDFVFPVPPLKEQALIVDKLDIVLGRVDSCRERLDRTRLLLKRLRQSVLTAAISGKLTEDWRETTSSKDGTANEHVLHGWSTCSIGEVVDLIDGDRGPNYPKQSEYLTDGYCLFLSTKNVREFGFDFSDTVFISEKKHNTLRAGTLQRNDVVITTRGTLGNVAVYDDSVSYCNVRINSGMLILRRKSTDLCPQLLKLFIASPMFSSQLMAKRSGSAQPQIPAGILKNFVISIPPAREQQEIVRRTYKLMSLVSRIEERVKVISSQLSRLTPSILDTAFRGELVPQDTNGETAFQLLA